MAARRVEVFFYGLFMDQLLLLGKGVRPTDIRPALVRGLALRIGARAALVPTPAGQVHGRLMKLTHARTERNPEYAAKLRSLAQRVGLPDHYVASIQ